jgi:iron complex outermembrane receptor protein
MKKLLTIAFAVSFIHSYAQTDLDPVTVTASISKTKISATGRDVTLIKGEVFNKLPVHSIDELLRYVPGIEVQQRGPQGSQSDILIRGGSFQQVLVILDGIRLNDPLTGHFNSYIPIAPAEIERVEILKGASSAIYGSEAVGGVIHIITKTYTAKQGDKHKEFSAQARIGEYDLANVNAGGSYQHGSSAFSLGVISNNTAGQPQRGINGYFHNTTVSASVRQFIGKYWSIGLRSAFDRRNFAAQNFYTAFASDTAVEQVDSWWNHVNVRFEKGKQSFTFDAGYKQAKDEYDFNKAALPNLNKSKIAQALAIYQLRVNEKTRLSAGTQFLYQSIRSNDRGDHSVTNAGAFVLLHQQVGNLNIIPALRVDWNELTGWELTPQVNASYRYQRLIIRASAGKSTRIADFTERYNNYNKALVTSGNIGNPDLNAEKAWNLEAGADYFIGNGWKLSATLFTKYYDNLVDWVNTPYSAMPRKDNLSPAGNYFLASNISKLNTSGVEGYILYNKAINTHHSLEASAGFTWLNSSSTPSLYISSHAKWLLNYSVLYRWQWLQLSVNGLYKARTPQASNGSLIALSRDYFIMNSRIAATLKQFGIFVQCDNIGDRKYADRFGVLMPGRWWSGGLSFGLH